MNYLRGMQLQHLFKHAELTEGVSQNDQLFIDLLNEAQVGNIDDVEKLLRERFTQESDKNYPRDALDIYAENKPDIKMNKAVLNDLPDEFKQQRLMTKFQIIVNTHWQQFKLLRIRANKHRRLNEVA